MDENRLRYRRQFLLCRDIVPALSHWNCLRLLNGCYIYSHPDLNITYKERNGKEIALLGYIFDPVHYAKDNKEILDDIEEKSGTFDSFLEKIKSYAGQFVFIYLNKNVFRVIHDALALRELYYCTAANNIICGSQPNLIKEYSDPPLHITTDKLICRFYEDDMKKVRAGRFWVGDETYYDGIKHLLPNHYLDITELRAIRYWPRQNLATIELDEAVRLSCLFLQGILKAATNRYELMMAVTGGTDSRSLLAASRGVKEKIYYFINKHKNLDEKHPDIYIPKAIFERIKIPFHVHSLDGNIDERFREIFLGNTFLSTDLVLPAIYNVYFKQHSQRLNILGVGEIGRAYFGAEPRNLNGYYLARSLKFRNSPYAVEQCQKWLDSTLPIARIHGVNTMTLLLWEQLLGNWGTVGNSESDIAIEEFDPYNSHYLYEILLGIDKKYTKYGEGILFSEMIRQMWPELLEFPFNPPYKKPDFIKFLLKKIGLFTPLKTLYYKVDRMKFRLTHRQHSQRRTCH